MGTNEHITRDNTPEWQELLGVDGLHEADEDDGVYRCPICGEPLTGDDEVYINADGECVGCEACVRVERSVTAYYGGRM